ncbi:hypothetical protein EB001_01400 [bacterium]|nr:hypothetical protein [bacterium]
MYLSALDIIAICIALILQMCLNILLVISVYNWKKMNSNTARLLNQERKARAYWQEHKETI